MSDQISDLKEGLEESLKGVLETHASMFENFSKIEGCFRNLINNCEDKESFKRAVEDHDLLVEECEVSTNAYAEALEDFAIALEAVESYYHIEKEYPE